MHHADAQRPGAVHTSPRGEGRAAPDGADAAGESALPDPLRALLDAIGDGIVVADERGNLLHWNPAALRLHGYSSLAEVRRHLSQFPANFVLSLAERGPALPLDQWPMARGLRHERVHQLELAVHRLDTGGRWIISYDAEWTRTESDGRSSAWLVLTLRDMTALRRAERAQEEAQRHLRELVESLPQLVWTCRSDGNCDYLSPQWVAYTGMDAGTHLGYGWMETVHPDDRTPLVAAWNSTIAGGGAIDLEFRIRRHDGAYRWFKARAVPMRDSSGAILRWFGTNTDIHDQRLAAETQATLAAIVEHTSDAIVGKTLDGTIISWNHSAERLFGYRAEEAIGRNISLLLPADRPDEQRFILEEVRRGRGVNHFESQRVTKGGRVIDVALTVSPLRDSGGRIVGASKIARDITHEKRAAEALRESEARFRRLADAMPQIVWTSSPEGVTTYLNRRWTESTGLTTASPELLPELVHPDDLGPLQAAWADARRRGCPYEAEFRLRHRDGGPYRWFLGRAVPIIGSSGEVVEWFGTSTDIQDLKHAEALARDNEARLRERQVELAHLERVRTMGQMASGLAHELNQPLGAIANYARACRDMLESKNLGAGRVCETLTEVQSEALRAGEIIQRLRRLVKKQQPAARPCDINEVVDDTTRLLAFDVRAAGIEVDLRLGQGLPLVHADRVQIGQVLINLCRNAIDAMQGVEPARRRLTVATSLDRADPPVVRVGVTDRGCGVSAENLGRVFDAFFTTKPGGLGIGLALSRTIIDDHGGRLIATPNPGGGMTFAFDLPAASSWLRPKGTR